MSHILLCLRAEQRKHIPFLLRRQDTSIYMPILHPSLHCFQAHPILNILFTVAQPPATGWPCIFKQSLEILKWTPPSTSVCQWHKILMHPVPLFPYPIKISHARSLDSWKQTLQLSPRPKDIPALWLSNPLEPKSCTCAVTQQDCGIQRCTWISVSHATSSQSPPCSTTLRHTAC